MSDRRTFLKSILGTGVASIMDFPVAAPPPPVKIITDLNTWFALSVSNEIDTAIINNMMHILDYPPVPLKSLEELGYVLRLDNWPNKG